MKFLRRVGNVTWLPFTCLECGGHSYAETRVVPPKISERKCLSCDYGIETLRGLEHTGVILDEVSNTYKYDYRLDANSLLTKGPK